MLQSIKHIERTRPKNNLNFIPSTCRYIVHMLTFFKKELLYTEGIILLIQLLIRLIQTHRTPPSPLS